MIKINFLNFFCHRQKGSAGQRQFLLECPNCPGANRKAWHAEGKVPTGDGAGEIIMLCCVAGSATMKTIEDENCFRLSHVHLSWKKRPASWQWAAPTGMIIVIFFNLMKVLWITCHGGFFVLIVSFLSFSYRLPQTSPSILTYVGKAGELTSFQSSRQPVTWPPGFDYNYLELVANYYGLLALLAHVEDCPVKIMSNNICAVFYINKLRGWFSIYIFLFSYWNVDTVLLTFGHQL